MKLQREIENPMLQFPYRKPSPVIAICACGCHQSITDEFAYIRWEGMYFDDRSCLIRYLSKYCGLEEVG